MVLKKLTVCYHEDICCKSKKNERSDLKSEYFQITARILSELRELFLQGLLRYTFGSFFHCEGTRINW